MRTKSRYDFQYECRQIMSEAVHLYAERFPDRVHSLFCFTIHNTNIVQTFQETGSVDNKKRKRIKKATDDGNSTNILAAGTLNTYQYKTA